MNRSTFLRNMAGAVAAALIGPKASEFLTESAPGVPGIGGTLFKLTIAPGRLRPYDILYTQFHGQFYINKKLEAVSVTNPDFKLQIVEEPDAPEAVRMCSAYPER